jgi:predicted GNAT family N-acyltransferase
MASEAYELLKLCQDFIKEQKICCAEDVYQTDSIIENAYEFIEQICEIVGYAEEEEDNDEEEEE